MLPAALLKNRVAQPPQYQVNLVQRQGNLTTNQLSQKEGQSQVLKHVDNYIIFNEKLGGGQFSQVYKAMDKNDKTKYFAVKIISLSNKQFQKFSNYNDVLQKEIDILLKARHDNLICMHDLKQTSNNLYLFLDYCNGGNLRQHLAKKKNRLSEEESIEFLKQICAGYQALNEKMIIHRDLKPENVMLHDNKIKIGDFGFARIVPDVDEARNMTQKCSPLYAPPQILLNQKYSSKCDVWSLGCMLFEMVFGKPPFNSHSVTGLTENIMKTVGSGPYFLPSFPPLQKETKDILTKMLMFNEKDRISWEDIFRHPILKKDLQKKLVENVLIEPSNPLLQQSIRKNIEAVWDPMSNDQNINSNIPKQIAPITVTGIVNSPSAAVSPLKNTIKNIIGRANQPISPLQSPKIQVNNQSNNILNIDTPNNKLNTTPHSQITNFNKITNDSNTSALQTEKNNCSPKFMNNDFVPNAEKELPQNSQISSNFGVPNQQNQLKNQQDIYTQPAVIDCNNKNSNINNNNSNINNNNSNSNNNNNSNSNSNNVLVNKENIMQRANSMCISDPKQFPTIASDKIVVYPSTHLKKNISSPESTQITNISSPLSNTANNKFAGHPAIRGISPCRRNIQEIQSKQLSPNKISSLPLNEGGISQDSQSIISQKSLSPYSESSKDVSYLSFKSKEQNPLKKQSTIDHSSLSSQSTRDNNLYSFQTKDINSDISLNKNVKLDSQINIANIPSYQRYEKSSELYNNKQLSYLIKEKDLSSNQINFPQTQNKAEEHSQIFLLKNVPLTSKQITQNYYPADSSGLTKDQSQNNEINYNNKTENSKRSLQINTQEIQYGIVSPTNNYLNSNQQNPNNQFKRDNNSQSNLTSGAQSSQSLKINIPPIDKEVYGDDQYLLFMKQIKLKEDEKALATKIDSFFSFMRKRALFANATLLNFWNSTRSFQLPSHLQCQVLFCLCSYYLQGLEQLKKILTKEIQQTLVKEGAFKVYEKSPQFTQMKDKIIQDVKEAKQLFDAIEPFMLSEISLSSSPEAQSFLKFLQSRPNSHEDYREKLLHLFPKTFSFVDFQNLDKIAAKGIFMTQVFTHIQEFISSKYYQEFDFNKFYDDKFNNLSLEDLKKAISSFNLEFYATSKEPQ